MTTQKNKIFNGSLTAHEASELYTSYSATHSLISLGSFNNINIAGTSFYDFSSVKPLPEKLKKLLEGRTEEESKIAKEMYNRMYKPKPLVSDSDLCASSLSFYNHSSRDCLTCNIVCSDPSNCMLGRVDTKI